MFNDTDNTLGQPLATPSTQTMLPIICGGNGNLKGYFTIAKTTFTGEETSFMLAEGPVDITTVTLPDKVLFNNIGVQQYMAAVFPDDEVLQVPWGGYSSWINNNNTGYKLSYVMATTGWLTRLNQGTLITNLLVNMAADATVVPGNVPPAVSNAAIRWVASMNVNESQLSSCGFFDFLWTDLFATSSPSVDPLSISVVSNPPGGQFKSTLVPYPVITPLGGPQFNTVRIIKLQPAVAGTYTFNYVVTDTQNRQTPVSLVLTLV